MQDRELLIRIDERQKEQGLQLDKILKLATATNGRVGVLESEMNINVTFDKERSATIKDHSDRIMKIENKHTFWLGGWRAFVLIGGIVAVILDLIIRLAK